MKKRGILVSFLALSAAIMVSFTAEMEKFITIRFSEPALNYHWNSINQVKAIVDQSALPHNQVVFIVKSLDSLQKGIQASAKIDSAQKDTTPQKKK